MLSATCCKTIPFIFPLTMVKQSFKTKKRKINTICSVTSPLSFCYFTTSELGCTKKKKIIVISRHQGGLAQRSFVSAYLENNAEFMLKLCMFFHFPISSRTHSFSSQKVKEVWLQVDWCQRNLSWIKTDISLARQIPLFMRQKIRESTARLPHQHQTTHSLSHTYCDF